MRKGYAIKFDANGPYIELTDDGGNMRRFSVSEFKNYLDQNSPVDSIEIPEFYLELQKAMKSEPGQNDPENDRGAG